MLSYLESPVVPHPWVEEVVMEEWEMEKEWVEEAVEEEWVEEEVFATKEHIFTSVMPHTIVIQYNKIVLQKRFCK